jgi:hypothetical protein
MIEVGAEDHCESCDRAHTVVSELGYRDIIDGLVLILKGKYQEGFEKLLVERVEGVGVSQAIRERGKHERVGGFRRLVGAVASAWVGVPATIADYGLSNGEESEPYVNHLRHEYGTDRRRYTID